MAGPAKARGAISNPDGRFERTTRETVDDGWYRDEEAPGPATELRLDSERRIITTNDSPDVPFDYSINPCRGCEHGCLYCVDGDTPVLMADGASRPIGDLRVGDEMIGTARLGHYRTYAPARVLAHWAARKLAYRVRLADGTEIVASGDHRFLTERGWKHVIAGVGSQRPRTSWSRSARRSPGGCVRCNTSGYEAASGSTCASSSLAIRRYAARATSRGRR